MISPRSIFSQAAQKEKLRSQAETGLRVEQNLWLSQSDGKTEKKKRVLDPPKSWGSRKHENAILGGKQTRRGPNTAKVLN